MRNTLFTIGMVLAAGCAQQTATSTFRAVDNTLGITEITITESTNGTIINGLDAKGGQVARIEVTRGEFIWNEDDEAKGQVVDGRTMSIQALDQKTTWETAGYEPTMRMPVMRPQKLAELVTEPHIKAELATWKIGWDDKRVYTTTNETEYLNQYGDIQYGDGFMGWCSGGSCPIHNGGSTSAGCGSSQSGQWGAVTSESWTSPQEDSVLFCCNSGTNAGGWVGLKTCQWSGTGGTTSCGTAGGGARCSGACPGFGSGTSFDGGSSCEVWGAGGNNIVAEIAHENGGSCGSNTDCFSLICDSNTCAACYSQYDCDPAHGCYGGC